MHKKQWHCTATFLFGSYIKYGHSHLSLNKRYLNHSLPHKHITKCKIGQTPETEVAALMPPPSITGGTKGQSVSGVWHQNHEAWRCHDHNIGIIGIIPKEKRNNISSNYSNGLPSAALVLSWVSHVTGAQIYQSVYLHIMLLIKMTCLQWSVTLQ